MKGHSKNIPTRKKRVEIILPGHTEIYQPNRLTNSKYKSFTLMQSRILVTLIKELQEAILASMNGKNWQQLNLFPCEDHNLIRVPIYLKEIAKPRQYKEVYESVVQLGKVSIKLPSSISNEYYCIATLFPKVELPKTVHGHSVIYVELFNATASKLIEIDKTGNGKPGYFTKYLYEVAMSATNKYTYKLYMILASWKQKGGFKISLPELREKLGINDELYSDFCDFKKRVLMPIQKDLEYKSDCWFNCNAHGFLQRKDGKAIILNFKIIIPAPENIIREKADHLKYLLKTHFSFNELHLKAMDGFFSGLKDVASFEIVLLKLQDVKEKCTYFLHLAFIGKQLMKM